MYVRMLKESSPLLFSQSHLMFRNKSSKLHIQVGFLCYLKSQSRRFPYVYECTCTARLQFQLSWLFGKYHSPFPTKELSNHLCYIPFPYCPSCAPLLVPHLIVYYKHKGKTRLEIICVFKYDCSHHHAHRPIILLND